MHQQEALEGITHQASIEYSCCECTNISSVQDLLPINALCATNDIIPGVFKDSIGSVETETRKSDFKPLFIHKARVMISDDINRIVNIFIKEYAKEKGYEE